MTEEMKKEKTHVPKEKIAAVTKLAEEMKRGKTIMLVSIKNLPASQLQKIKKALRGKAVIGVAKKSIILRAIDETKINELAPMKDIVQEDSAVLISSDDAFEIAGWLTENKNPIAAKEGQISEADITVEEGPTDLVPGPAISELGALGIQIAVENGKISIKADRVVVNKGQTINEATASILQKLNIQPFEVGLNPIAIYDVENEKIYTDINIDSERAVDELKNAGGKALGFAQKIVYYCKETIGYFLGKANLEGYALERLSSKEENKEEEKDD